jgi:putative DNA primase/helicase
VVERMLAISGEDKITIDRKYASAVHCQLPSRIVVLSNEIPRLTDASGTIVTRFVLLKTNRSFLGAEDTELERKLAEEASGILRWAIEGLRRLHARGRFLQPAAGKELLAGMTDLASPITSFVRDCCEVKPAAECTKESLFAAFLDWCGQQGIERKGTLSMFGRDLISAFPQIRSKRTGSGKDRDHCYVGIQLFADVHDRDVKF